MKLPNVLRKAPNIRPPASRIPLSPTATWVPSLRVPFTKGVVFNKYTYNNPPTTSTPTTPLTHP